MIQNLPTPFHTGLRSDNCRFYHTGNGFETDKRFVLQQRIECLQDFYIRIKIYSAFMIQCISPNIIRCESILLSSKSLLYPRYGIHIKTLGIP